MDHRKASHGMLSMASKQELPKSFCMTNYAIWLPKKKGPDTNVVIISGITPHSRGYQGHPKVLTKVVVHRFVDGCIVSPITSLLIERLFQ
mmetsp:Transcript_27026/g.56307  ORF Transcript_27026/g.56307 Transcript_27026/m.56307 type:complete len:90 (+) Transcript_27026:331-600(+)